MYIYRHFADLTRILYLDILNENENITLRSQSYENIETIKSILIKTKSQL